MLRRYLSISPPAAKHTEPLCAGERAELERVVDWLADVTGDVPSAALTGGLAVAMLIGRFFRSHADIDLGVLEQDLPALRDRLRADGYEMYVVTASGRLAPGRTFGLLRRATPTIAARQSYRHLRFMRRCRWACWLPQDCIADRLDVYVHRLAEDQLLHLAKKSLGVPADLGRLVEMATPGGKPIRCFSADYLFWIKCRKGMPKDFDDMAQLRAAGFAPPPAAVRLLARWPAQPSPSAGVFPVQAVQE